MPKRSAAARTSALQPAGAAAVPTATIPAEHPNAAAAAQREAEYHRIAAGFSKELQRARMKSDSLQSLLQLVDDLWVFSSTGPFPEGLSHLVEACRRVFRLTGSTGRGRIDILVHMLMGRTLLTAGLYQRVVHFFITQEAWSDDASHCVFLLTRMMEGEKNEEMNMKKIPAISFEHSYMALAPALWNSHGLTLVCETLLSEDSTNSFSYGSDCLGYLNLLLYPPAIPSGRQRNAVAACTARADLNAVMRDVSCVSAILGLLHSPYAEKVALLLRTLVCNCPPTDSADSSHTHHSMLFQMGGANAIATALTFHTEEINLKRQKQRASGLYWHDWLAANARELTSYLMHLSTMAELLALLGHMAAHECPSVWLWPENLEQAHQSVLMKVTVEDDNGHGLGRGLIQEAVRPGNPFANDLCHYQDRNALPYNL